LHSHSPVDSDVVEKTLLSDFKSWWDISLGILFSWKLWLIHLCVNKTHSHTEYQYFLASFQYKVYLCYWVSLCKHCIV
jgi:hypothetical protein